MDLPDNLRDFPWLLFVLMAITGMAGGCGSASFQVLSGRQLTVAILLAYATLGAVLGAFSFLVVFVLAPSLSIASMLMVGGIMGAGSTVTVSVVRMGLRAVLRWKGIEVEIRIKDPQP